MTVHTQVDSLTVTVDGVDATCQVIKGSGGLTLDGYGSGEVTETECATDNKVTEPGDYEPGQFTGDLFVDSTTAGVLRKLVGHRQAGTTFPVVFKKWTGGQEATFTGTGRVTSLELPTADPGKFSRFPLQLEVTGITTTWGAVP